MSAESPEVTGQVAEPAAARIGPVFADCQHRLTALERQRLELLEVNKKWDEHYQRMKTFYKAKIQELRKRLAACEACALHEEERERNHAHFEEKLVQTEGTTRKDLKPNSEVCAQLLEAERQTQSLRLQVTDLTRRGQQQQSEIRRLNEVLSESLLGETESRMQVDLLRQQVRLHEEDFWKERADRKRLCDRNKVLERRIEKLHAELQKTQVSRKSACNATQRTSTPETHHHTIPKPGLCPGSC